MTGLELDNFYKADDKRYILNKNNEFISYEYIMHREHDLKPIINREQMQDLINQIVMFYEFKYPNNMLYSLKHSFGEKDLEKTIEISKMLDFEQLKFRLYHDYIQFLECSCGCVISLNRPKKHLCDIATTYISVDSDGKIDKGELEFLKEYQFLDDIDGISTIENLYGRYASIDTNVDYSELKRLIEKHRFNLKIRNKVLNVISFALLYSENTLPDYGYARAKAFIRTFNREYKLKMDLEEIDEIMNRDYSGKQKSLIKK